MININKYKRNRDHVTCNMTAQIVIDVHSDIKQAAFVTAFKAVQKDAFELVADTAQMHDLTSQLASLGLVLCGNESVVPQTPLAAHPVLNCCKSTSQTSTFERKEPQTHIQTKQSKQQAQTASHL